MRIPEDKIQEIRNATDIVEYIGLFVKLKKRGKNYLGLCPFHGEKTPSFNVSLDKQMYYCFGCQRGGDVVKFVMEWEKASYIEAIEILAERAHIEITRTDDGYQASNELEQLYNVCTFAAKLFYNNLRTTEEGKFALKYFSSRGFTDKTITTFGLGYSLRGWDGLLTAAQAEGISDAHLEKVGLVKRKEGGGVYDTFRGRAMFPVFSSTGRVIAFGARKIYDDDTVPGKYINSSETPIYHKSKVLFGLSQAKETIREKDNVILVEGYADLISVFQSGTQNIVASSGTALTAEQIQLIARYTKNITMVYDADSAGANAMMRGVDLILENGLDVRIVQLPAGDDPDSYVRKNGGEAFQSLVERAVSFVDFKASVYQREGKFDSPEGRAVAVREIVQTIAKIKDPLKHPFFIREVAEKYRLYESVLISELEKYTKKVPEKFRTAISHPKKESEKQETVSLHKAPVEIPIEEKELLAVLLEEPTNIIPFAFSHIQPSDFSHEHVRTLVNIILDEYDRAGDIELQQLHTKIDNDELRKIINDAAFARSSEDSRIQREVGARESETRVYELALGAIKRMKKRALEKELTEIRMKLKDASLHGNDVLEYMRRQNEILKAIKEVEEMQLVTK